jgi:hypothetical protein
MIRREFAPLASSRRERRAVATKRYAAAQWYCADHMRRTSARLVADLRSGWKF